MSAYHKLVKYLDSLDVNKYKMLIEFYNYEDEELTSEANDKTMCLILNSDFKETRTYKRFLGIPIKTIVKKTYDVYGELKSISDVSIKIRSFGKFGSGTLMNIVRKWANENETKVEYNVELVLDYYVVHEKKYKYFWQKNYTSL
jgi:hypothetical protein